MDEILEILEENARISIEDLARLVKKSRKEGLLLSIRR